MNFKKKKTGSASVGFFLKKKKALYLEIWVCRGPAACSDARANTVVDHIRKVRFQGTEQGAPRTRRGRCAVDDGVEYPRACGVVCECE